MFENPKVLHYRAMEKLILKGTPASAGVAEGIIKVVSGYADAPNFLDDQILVAEMTEPTMVMMMNKAAAIVTNHGGITSHPAIVSRELGIPCVVATNTATTTLTDGMRVRVNGSTGEIFLLE